MPERRVEVCENVDRDGGEVEGVGSGTGRQRTDRCGVLPRARSYASQFYSWRKRLRGTAAEKFLEVQLVKAQSRRVPSSRGAIEIRLAEGRSILVEPGFDADHLRAVEAGVFKLPKVTAGTQSLELRASETGNDPGRHRHVAIEALAAI